MEIEQIASEIDKLKTSAENLQRLCEDLPALDRNLQRIFASIKMLELNFSDPISFGQSK